MEFDEIRCIGRGNYGTAHLVKDVCTGSLLVVKKIALALLSPKERDDSMREVQVLSRLKHPNIVEYVGSFEREEMLHIVMGYCEGGDLAAQHKAVRSRGQQHSEQQILDWVVQLALALRHIHGDHHILHRDLKSSNVFLTKNNVLKLGDFGISRALDSTVDQAQTVIGTPMYLSPEVCENKPYSFKSDIWAMGCVVYEMCALQHPFRATNLLGLVSKIVAEPYDPIPDCYSTELRNLVATLLDKNPEHRPSAVELLTHSALRTRLMEMTQGTGGTLGRRVVNYRMTAKARREERRRRESVERGRALAEVARQSLADRAVARDKQQAMFRPSTAEHAMPLSAGDIHAMGASPQRLQRARAERSPRPHAVPSAGGAPEQRVGSVLEHREFAAAQTPPRSRSALAEAPPWADASSWGERDGGELLGSSRFERAPSPEEQVWERTRTGGAGEAGAAAPRMPGEDRPIKASGRYWSSEAELDRFAAPEVALAASASAAESKGAPYGRPGRPGRPARSARAAGPSSSKLADPEDDHRRQSGGGGGDGSSRSRAAESSEESDYYSDDFESDEEAEALYAPGAEARDAADMEAVLELCQAEVASAPDGWEGGITSARSDRDASWGAAAADGSPQRARGVSDHAGAASPAHRAAASGRRSRSSADPTSGARPGSGARSHGSSHASPSVARRRRSGDSATRLEHAFGRDAFERVYDYFRTCFTSSRSPDSAELRKLVGSSDKAALDMCREVEVLAFREMSK